MKKEMFWVVITLCLTLVWVYIQIPDEKMHVVFCDVGQGDGSLIVYRDFQMLVDTGPSAEKILSCLAHHMPFWDRSIEVVMISHDQRDHAGALLEIQKRYAVGKLVREDAVAGDTVNFADAYFKILFPTRDARVLGVSTNQDSNKTATVGELSFKNFKVLFTADIGFDEENILIKSGVLEDVDVLKVAHHGSKFSTQGEFLNILKPEISIIQVGKNSYGHPTKEVLERLYKTNTKVYRNDENGEIEIISDGKEWWIVIDSD
jgi:competence protein ComEC